MIDIIIVNWNSGSQLRECLDSIASSNYGEARRIIVVDNDSSDGSANDIDQRPLVEVIQTGDNLGFGVACNIGAEASQAPYLLFLNPDAQLTDESLSLPLAWMERAENASVGICGVQLVDNDQHVARTCARFPTLGRLICSALGFDKLPGFRSTGFHMSDWDHLAPRDVDHVMGAFYLIRRSVFEQVGGFDQRFFMYLEDVDLSKMAGDAGWRSHYLANVRAFHTGGGTSRQVKVHRLFYSLRSRLIYADKHFPRWQFWVLMAVTNLIEPFTRSLWCLVRGDLAGAKQTWLAYRMLWQSMCDIIHGRGRVNP